VTAVLYAVCLVLTANMLVGLVRVALGPTTTDRLSAVLLLASTGVGLLVVLSVVTSFPTLRDVALVLVVLSALVVVVFVGEDVTGGRTGRGPEGTTSGDSS
jgi:multicomponent Na+:H+ antiporter subunit F